MNTFPTLLKREYWEHRGGFLWAPVIAGGIFLVFLLMAMLVAQAGMSEVNIQIGALRLSEITQGLDPAARARIGVGIDVTLLTVAGQLGIVVGIVVFFYCLACLYDERRDRSVLFWKSLPVSDRDTVLSKAVSALFVAPLIGVAAGIATGLGMLALLGVYFAFHGANVFGLLFGAANPLEVATMLLALIPLHAVWALPTVGWLMLCSAWARSKPFLWAIAIPVGAGILVSWFDLMRTLSLSDGWFWREVVARLLLSVIPGSWLPLNKLESLSIHGPEDFMRLTSLGNVYQLMLEPSLWIWAAIGAGMILLAIRLRRWRDEG